MSNLVIGYWVRGAEYAHQAMLSAASAARFGHHAVVVTESQDVSDLLRMAGLHHVTVIERRDLAALAPMQANLEAQLTALHWAIREGAKFLLGLDTDTLMNEALPPYTTAGVDFLVTYRKTIVAPDGSESDIAQMPYNYGVTGYSTEVAGLETLLWVRRRVVAMSQDLRQWYGNQRAVAELLGPPVDGYRRKAIRIPAGVVTTEVASFPCDTHNYTPQAEDEDLSGRLILHFKGHRRHLLPVYARRLGLLP